MKRLVILLLASILLVSCSHQKELEARARHQAETGDRLNRSQQDTDSLFKEIN